jgi:hypothetical protein
VDSSGSFNTGVGGGALALNNGDSNTAVGAAALLLNTSGTLNTAIGTDAMVYNESGANNTAIGAFALFSNIDGSSNNALGYQALGALQTGSGNNAFGDYALGVNNGGSGNNAFGESALEFNSTGSRNTAIGEGALDNSTGDFNTALGFAAGGALETGNNNIYVGDAGFFEESNVIAIGRSSPSGTPYENTYIGGIYDTVVTDRIVYVGSDGHLGTLASSRRYKEKIKPMDKASEALFALKPVTFHYKQEIDPLQKLSFGLVAEDVAQVSGDLVSRDKEGKPQTVRYDAVNAMLLNEFLKEHKAFVEEQHKVEKLQATVASLVTTVKQQAAQIQNVSRELEMNKAASQVAANVQ